MNENSSIRDLKGIGEKLELGFAKLGVRTVGDLLHYYPRSYDIYESSLPINQLEEGKISAVSGQIRGTIQVGRSRTLKITSLQLEDKSGRIKVLWYQMPYLKTSLKNVGEITLRGKIVNRQNQLLMEHPEIFAPAESYQKKLDSLQPIYPLTSGISNHLLSKTVKQVLDLGVAEKESLPEEIRTRYGLCGLAEALKGIHFPENKEEYYKSRRRLVFDEFFLFLLAVQGLQKTKEKGRNNCPFQPVAELENFLEQLPYRLTGAQMRVWKEIKGDLEGKYVMSRLVQGDVGSGKTIVAVLALFDACLNGCQAAMMAPTEVLARQHYISVQKLIQDHDLPIHTVLLTGSVKGKDRKVLYEKIASGKAQLIIGTQALIQEKLSYHRLALVVTDEQHRFGVRQREKFAQKAITPHILVMSATPIPRTLALILYGDLDISVIDELPASRKPIKNCVVDSSYRASAYRFMRQQIVQGRQCYVICPLLEESESLEAENVLEYTKMLQREMGETIRVAGLHGKMKSEQKEEIMESFKVHRIDILVSTTVIEVGIDVPNATMMLIENADRFGLSQLHQLRGRVGRGKEQSYCVFMSGSKAKTAKDRLSVLEKSNDGFFIAKEDLRLRGPGDVFGIRQSGLMDFRIGDVFQDAALLQAASQAAKELLRDNPDLDGREWAGLKGKLQTYLRECGLEQTL